MTLNEDMKKKQVARASQGTPWTCPEPFRVDVKLQVGIISESSVLCQQLGTNRPRVPAKSIRNFVSVPQSPFLILNHHHPFLCLTHHACKCKFLQPLASRLTSNVLQRQSRGRASAAPRSAPAQTRSASTAAAPSGYAPSHAPAPPAAAQAASHSQPQQPGMLAPMAATAGSVAVGSTIGHGLSSMLFGGGSASESPAPAQAAPAQQQQGISCEAQAKGTYIGYYIFSPHLTSLSRFYQMLREGGSSFLHLVS